MNWIGYGVVGLFVLSMSMIYMLKIEEQHVTWKSGVLMLFLSSIWPVMFASLLAILGGGLFLYGCDKWNPSKGRVIIHSKRKAAREMADRMLKEEEEPKQAWGGASYAPGSSVGYGPISSKSTP